MMKLKMPSGAGPFTEQRMSKIHLIKSSASSKPDTLVFRWSGKGEEYILRGKLGALGRFLVLFLVVFARSLRVDRNGEWYGFGRGLGKTGSRVFRLAGGAAAWASCVVSTSNPGRAEFDILMLAENWPGASFWERIVSPSAAAAMMLAAHFCYCGNTLAK